MLHAILGKKIRQTQEFTPDGKRIPVTEIIAGPCTIVAIKIPQKDGYWGLQLGFDNKITKHINKAQSGHLKKTGQGNFSPRFLREVRLETVDGALPFKIGDQITLDQVLEVGTRIKVTGISKAKGFAGGVKRHGFKGGPRTHGQSDRERAPGSIGQTTTPGRVYKGKRMAGRMGRDTVTIVGLTVVGVDKEKNLLKVKGLIPGNTNSLIIIQKQ